MSNDQILKCDRCQAEASVKHPLHGFIVRLEEVSYKGKTMSVCQRCKIQIEVKKRQASGTEEKGQINNFFSKILGLGK